MPPKKNVAVKKTTNEKIEKNEKNEKAKKVIIKDEKIKVKDDVKDDKLNESDDDEKKDDKLDDSDISSDDEKVTPNKIEINDIVDEAEEFSSYTYKEPIRGDYEIIVISRENRITSDLMSKEEMTEAVSERIKQLEKESIAFVDTSDLTDPVSIAKREISQRKCPLVLRRCIGYKLNKETGKQTYYYEYWDVNEMEHYVTFS